jgi:hypothetical protein
MNGPPAIPPAKPARGINDPIQLAYNRIIKSCFYFLLLIIHIVVNKKMCNLHEQFVWKIIKSDGNFSSLKHAPELMLSIPFKLN